MLGSLARHSFGAILLAVIIEELGLPLPIPTDLMIVFAGTAAGHSLLSRLWQTLGLTLITLAVFGVVLASLALVRRDNLLGAWWQAGGPVMVLGAVFAVAICALTAVYGRGLAIAALPAFRSRRS